jgi:hypothetical protein
MTLDELKDIRYAEIDMNTQDLISKGFPFAGHMFSMSITAQINWSNFPNLPDALFPLTIIDMLEGPYVLALADKLNFYYTALNYKNTQLQSGGVLKGTIKACADVACVTAVVDTR